MGNTYPRIKSRKQEKWRRQKVHEPRAHQSIVVGKPQLCCHSNFRTWILKDSTTLGVEAHFIKNERMCHSTLATMEWVSKCIPIKNLNTKQKSKITQRDVIWKPSWYVAMCHQTVLFRPLNDHNNDMTGQFLNCNLKGYSCHHSNFFILWLSIHFLLLIRSRVCERHSCWETNQTK